MRTLKAIAATGGGGAALGEQVDANARVYLPPSAAQVFAGIDVGDRIETPLGSGTVVATSSTDGSLTVRITREVDTVPVLVN